MATTVTPGEVQVSVDKRFHDTSPHPTSVLVAVGINTDHVPIGVVVEVNVIVGVEVYVQVGVGVLV
jgi:hypothetical protein